MRSQTRGNPLPLTPTARRALVAAGVGAILVLAPGLAVAQPAPPDAPVAPAAPPADAPRPPPAVAPLAESLSGMARAEYEAGRILYADKDFANAIVKFQKAHELSGDPRLLWNVAVCEKNLRHYGKMLRTIKRYRQEAAPVLTDEERAQAVEIIKTVETFVSALQLTASEAGADVFVDGEKLGTTPLAEPIVVDVGTRRIRVVKAGFKEVALSREIVGGGEVRVDVPLEKEIHRGRLQVFAGADDLILLDGKTVGRGTWDGSLVSGGHTLRVTAPGMAAYQSEVVIQDENVRRVDVALTAAPRTDTTRTVLWIVGGVVLTAGAAVGGAFLFKPSTTTPVSGNVPPHPGTVQLAFGSHGFSLRGAQ
jgi:PEGA domain